jgi:ABC-type sugar transport system substrate-binding protein
LLPAALLALVAVGCSQPAAPVDAKASANSASAAPADGKRTIVMIPKATQSSFWNAVRRGG